MGRRGGASGRGTDTTGDGGQGEITTSGGEPYLIARRPRARDRLKLTDSPIHPFDQAYGLDTSGLVPARHLRTGSPSDEHVTAYYGVAPSILRSLVQEWRATDPSGLVSAWTFLDIGCGKGRAVLVASELGFRRVVGVELNPALAAVARGNIAVWTAMHAEDPTAVRAAPMEVLEQDALELELPAGPVVLFLFHPFEAPLLDELLERVEAQISRRRKARLDILYVNAECREVFARRGRYTQLFLGPVRMTPEDHVADLAAIAQQQEYGSTGDEECAIFRYSAGR